jgi:AcrR family transcriptional regulator
MARTRRSTQEVRSLLLTAARELFAERGYGGTSTREIADRAGVDVTILFRNFGTKERIFQEAVARPIDEFLATYTDRWITTRVEEGDHDDLLRTFVEALYDLAQNNRELLLAATPHHLGHGAQAAFGRLEHMAAEIAATYDYRYDPHVAVRAAVAMVITIAIFDEPLFGDRGAANRDRIITECTDLLTYGLTRRPRPG